MTHGDYNDAASWVASVGDDSTVPFHLQLVDKGYDVWLANNRGTWYSQGHNSYDATKDDDYWKFDWGDMGLYDTKAFIDKVKSETKQDKIYYVGYS